MNRPGRSPRHWCRGGWRRSPYPPGPLAGATLAVLIDRVLLRKVAGVVGGRNVWWVCRARRLESYTQIASA